MIGGEKYSGNIKIVSNNNTSYKENKDITFL